MAERVLLVMARRAGRHIAGAVNFLGDDAIYGRNWGALEERPFLHFELCYYQAIEFAIRRGYRRVEAGAQGEHKIARGYRPVVTHSAHQFADPRLGRGDLGLSGPRARGGRRMHRGACGGASVQAPGGRAGVGVAPWQPGSCALWPGTCKRSGGPRGRAIPWEPP